MFIQKVSKKLVDKTLVNLSSTAKFAKVKIFYCISLLVFKNSVLLIVLVNNMNSSSSDILHVYYFMII